MRSAKTLPFLSISQNRNAKILTLFQDPKTCVCFIREVLPTLTLCYKNPSECQAVQGQGNAVLQNSDNLNGHVCI